MNERRDRKALYVRGTAERGVYEVCYDDENRSPVVFATFRGRGKKRAEDYAARLRRERAREFR
jgi:hypothetical protein